MVTIHVEIMFVSSKSSIRQICDQGLHPIHCHLQGMDNPSKSGLVRNNLAVLATFSQQLQDRITSLNGLAESKT